MSGPRPTFQAPFVSGLLACVLTLLLQLPFADDDFDVGFESMIGARFQGPIHRAWDRGGFFELGGRPMLAPLPTDPPSGRTYASHPPLAHWMFRVPVALFGLSEFSLRILPILCAALCGLLLATLLAMRFGPQAGTVAALVWAGLPMVFFYGRMANYESPLLLFVLAAILCLQRKESRYVVFAALFMFLATFTDWAAGFFIPGIALFCWSRKLGLRPVLACSAAVALAVAAYLGLLSLWEGGLGAAFEALREAQGLAQDTETFTFSTFWQAQVDHLFTNFGVGATGITVLGILICALRVKEKKADEFDLLVLTSVIATLINIALFPARAFNHDFWWYYLLVAVLISVTRCVASITHRHRALGLVVLVALLLEGGDRIMERYQEEKSGESQKLAGYVDDRFGARDLVLMEGNFGSWQFLCDAWVYDAIQNEGEAVALIRRFLAGEIDADHLGVWYPVRLDYENPDALKRWQELGAEHEQFGASAILKFKSPR